MADTRTPYELYVDYCTRIGSTPLTEERWGLFTASRSVHISPRDSAHAIQRGIWEHTKVENVNG